MQEYLREKKREGDKEKYVKNFSAYWLRRKKWPQVVGEHGVESNVFLWGLIVYMSQILFQGSGKVGPLEKWAMFY